MTCAERSLSFAALMESMKDRPLKNAKQQKPISERIIEPHDMKSDDLSERQRLEKLLARKTFVPTSQGTSKVTEREKRERLLAKMREKEIEDPRTGEDTVSLTQQIHREDPQAGYDQPPEPDTKQNGKVPPNPKDGRNETA